MPAKPFLSFSHCWGLVGSVLQKTARYLDGQEEGDSDSA